jgi:agmatine deiminase
LPGDGALRDRRPGDFRRHLASRHRADRPEGARKRRALSFRFNGWGGKYDLEGDDTIGLRLAETAAMEATRFEWILEGGAVDVDGHRPSRHHRAVPLEPEPQPDMSREEVERRLRDDLGATRVLGSAKGLVNDHTDGHVDNLARFVAEKPTAIPAPAGEGRSQRRGLRGRAAQGREFGVEVVPCPRPVDRARRGDHPASYMNFYIGNAAVVIPLYGAQRRAAVERSALCSRAAPPSASAPTMS